MRIVEESFLKRTVAKLNRYALKHKTSSEFFNGLDELEIKPLQDLSFQSDLKYFDEINFILSVISSIISHPHISTTGEHIVLRTELANEAVTFELAARFYSEDPATRTNGGQMADPTTGSSYFEIDQLKPQDYAAIKNLKEGEISESFESLDNEGRDGNTVYKIIKVDKIIPAHPATFTNDYTLLLNLATEAKRMEAIDKFVDEKIKSTLIIIDPLFKDCDFEREGWSEKFRK